MIINTAGEYTLQYTATDACGNSTTVERDLVVEAPPTYRTVLYTDGTFIINESSVDEADNIAQHGAATNVYAPFDPNGATNTDKYIFGSAGNRPWNNQASSIKSVEIGSEIYPTSTAYWFAEMTTCTSINLANLKTNNVTTMERMFSECSALTTVDLSHFNTSNVANMSYMFYANNLLQSLDLTNFDTSSVTNMQGMFYECRVITSIDLSSFDTNIVTNMSYMFRTCKQLATIYASALFVVTQVTSSSNMFSDMSTNLVGGAGTTWASSSSVPKDKTYAHIDGGTSDPGFFTAKS